MFIPYQSSNIGNVQQQYTLQVTKQVQKNSFISDALPNQV